MDVKWRRGPLWGILFILVALVAAGPGPETIPRTVLLGVAASPLVPAQNIEDAISEFETQVGRTVNIVHYYKRGQTDVFPKPAELARTSGSGAHRILFYNWKPDGLTWRQVADGGADGYLRQLGSHLAQSVTGQFFFSVNAEMEDEVNPSPDSGQTAMDFRAFFRHVIEVLRASAGQNLVSVMNYTGAYKWAIKPWFTELYPGDDVVDWIAQDPYAYDPVSTPDLDHLVNRSEGSWPGFYDWAAATFPKKPQMLAEWGVNDSPQDPYFKAAFFNSVSDQLKHLPKLRALVYWDHSGKQASGARLTVGTTAVSSSPTSLKAFRNFAHSVIMASPFQYPEDLRTPLE